MMRYVEVCELLARAQETYYIMKQLANFCDKRNEYGPVEARQHPRMPCEALKFSS